MATKRKPTLTFYWSWENADWFVRMRLTGANGEIMLPPEQHRDQTDASRAAGRIVAVMVGIHTGDTLVVEAGPKPLGEPAWKASKK